MYSVFEEHSTEGLTEDATDSAESVERRREEEEALRAIFGDDAVAVEESVDALGTIRVTLEPGIWNAEATAMPRLTLSCLRRRGYPEKRPVEVDLRDTKNVPGAALRELRAEDLFGHAPRVPARAVRRAGAQAGERLPQGRVRGEQQGRRGGAHLVECGQGLVGGEERR